ncbi:MAG: SIS domain-containing protein [Gammaproteobacteria bacterium]|nr:SIS domain-containing protein [Gammaproteobacteria bacterium]MCY4357209.1 SIS domain-containing protein [Gammaproteobacteria bacterium]
MPCYPLKPYATRMFQETGEVADTIEHQQLCNASLIEKIASKLKRISPRLVFTCARGSSDHAATYAKYLFETRMGVAVCSFAPSVASLYAAPTNFQETVFIAISQSGRSPDLLNASQAAKAGGAYLLALVNEEISPLADLADDVIPISAGPELSVAATKSCIGAMSAIYHLCAEWQGNNEMRDAFTELKDALNEAWSIDWSQMLVPLHNTRQALILSRGIGLAGAQEAALKLKETCMIQAEAISAAEVRHGPMSIVDAGFRVIAIATFDKSQQSIDSICQDFLNFGACLLVAGKPLEGALCLPTPCAPDPGLQPLVFLQAFYKFANALSIDRDLDPDNPRNLSKVTETV